MTFSVETTDSSTLFVGNDLNFPGFVVTAANKIVVLVCWGETGTGVAPATVTRDGQSFTRIVRKDDSGSPFEHVDIWYLDSPHVGSFQLVISFNSPPSQRGAGAITFIDSAAAFVDFGSNAGTSANPSATVAGSSAGNIVVSVLATDLGPDGTTTNLGTSIFDFEDVASDSDFAGQYQTASGANHVASWTSAAPSGAWACAAAAFSGTTVAGLPLMGQAML